MKTPEEWLEEIKASDPETYMDSETIAAIQSDAREGMVPFDMPKLMPTTAKLVLDFAKALADKLAAAEVKYGYGDSWATPDAEDWPHPKCFTDLVKHLQKGDPRDVAIYCAFLWFHSRSTSNCLDMAGFISKDRLQAVERDNGLLKEQIRVADVAYQSLHERHQAAEKENAELRALNSLAQTLMHKAREERDRYKEALDPTIGVLKSISLCGWPHAAADEAARMAKEELARLEALQPAQKDAPQKGTK